MSLRKVIFWLHLSAGVGAGLVILVMSATGVALAFEKEIVAWAERDVRRVTPPAEAKALPLDALLAKVREQHPGARPSGMKLHADPSIAVLVSLGRTNGFYVNPYTAEVRSQGAKGTRAFMQTMLEWHRYLGRQANQRPMGKAITGVCNAVFCVLAITGLYLWWPLQWTKNNLRAVTLFNWRLRGKARDWNWHNVIGLWSAPVLIVLTATALPISYRWAGNLIYTLTRSEPPAQVGPGTAPAVHVPIPPLGTQPLPYEALLTSVQRQAPKWQHITLRLGGGGARGGGEQRRAQNLSPTESRDGERAVTNRGTPQAVTFIVNQRDGSPRFATAQFSLHPFTGEILQAERFSNYNRGRRVRSWTRYLHTGEALGPTGQFLAGTASLGGVLLVYTGFVLAWRRFLRRKQTAASSSVPAVPSSADQ